MRFDTAAADEMVWGLQVRRDIHRRGETDRWVGIPRGAQGRASRFGHLVFEERVSPPRRVELLPYTFVRRADLATADPEHGMQGGLDVRLGLGTGATLSATVNPDFAQVEQDPAVLNLSVFETFFPEKRPFFLEDSRTFVLPYGQFPLFHSRRIGARPGRLALEAGDELVDQPDQTTILGAAKLTGKASTWTYGALTALTAREYATVDAVTADDHGNEQVTRVERLIEPLTSYSVGRLQRDILSGSSNVGAIATAVVREGDANAFTGGGDYNLRWNRNRWAFQGHWAGTRAPFADGLCAPDLVARRSSSLSEHMWDSIRTSTTGHLVALQPQLSEYGSGLPQFSRRQNRRERAGLPPSAGPVGHLPQCASRRGRWARLEYRQPGAGSLRE